MTASLKGCPKPVTSTSCDDDGGGDGGGANDDGDGGGDGVTGTLHLEDQFTKYSSRRLISSGCLHRTGLIKASL